MKALSICFVVAIAALLAGAQCQARVIILRPEKVVPISSASQPEEVRLLLSFGQPSTFIRPGATVEFALLCIEARAQNCAFVQFDARPITTDWTTDPAVSWNSPWIRAGGDFSEQQQSSTVSLAGPSELKQTAIDVTSIVRGWNEGSLPNYGIAIIPFTEQAIAAGLPVAEYRTDNIILKIFYSKQ